MKKIALLFAVLCYTPVVSARNAVNISAADILLPIIGLLLLPPLILGGLAALFVKEKRGRAFKTWFFGTLIVEGGLIICYLIFLFTVVLWQLPKYFWQRTSTGLSPLIWFGLPRVCSSCSLSSLAHVLPISALKIIGRLLNCGFLPF